jgi:hypothetical protein
MDNCSTKELELGGRRQLQVMMPEPVGTQSKKRGRHARGATRAMEMIRDQLLYEATNEVRAQMKKDPKWQRALRRTKTDAFAVVAAWNPWYLQRTGVVEAYYRHKRRLS